MQDTETQRERDQLLTADEVAALMRVTRAWVYAETRRDALRTCAWAVTCATAVRRSGVDGHG